MTEKPRQVAVTSDFLKTFPWPLWDKLTLDLDSSQTLPAIQGWQDGFRFTILELQHRDCGLENVDLGVTTFFIVAIPESQKGRVVGWYPVDCQVSVDKAFVYLTRRPCKQARPGEWRDLINATIKVVESLQTREETAGQVRAPTFRPVGASAFGAAFNAIFFLALAVLMIGYGVATMLGWVDYRTGCFAHQSAIKCLDTEHAYRVIEAILEGGKIVLVGLFFAWGAHNFRERVRTLRRIKDDA